MRQSRCTRAPITNNSILFFHMSEQIRLGGKNLTAMDSALRPHSKERTCYFLGKTFKEVLWSALPVLAPPRSFAKRSSRVSLSANG